MKKLSLLFSFLFLVGIVSLNASLSLTKGTVFDTSYGELQLEDYYMSTPYKISYVVESGDVTGDEHPSVEEPDRRSVTSEETRIEIYNEDMTPDKVIKLSDLDPNALRFVSLESAKLGDKRFYVTESLFNGDDLYEFIILAKEYFAVVNENGDVLYKELFEAEFESGSDFSVHLFETSSLDNTYLLVESVNLQWVYTTTMYRINKYGASGIDATPQLTKVKSYPNPVKEYVTVDYDLGAASEGMISLVDLQGKTVLQKKIDNTSSTCKLSFGKFKSGIYVINVKAGDQIISSEKITVK